MLIGVTISLGIFSCSEDDSTNVNPNGVEAESAWIYAFRNETPQGRVYYMSAHENIPEASNSSVAVELGLNTRIYSYGEHPYTWNGDASTITKWKVDKETLELSVEGIMSLASHGIQGRVGPPAFNSETQAFSSKLSEGIIIEWNPTTMKITKIHNVEPLPTQGDKGIELAWVTEWNKYVHDNKIIFPIQIELPSQCCTYDSPGRGVMVGVFDIESGSLDYLRDERLLSSYSIPITDEADNIYLYPSEDAGFINPYFEVDMNDLPSVHNLLRFTPDGRYDENFSLNLKDILGGDPFYLNFNFITNNKLSLTYLDLSNYEFPENFDDRWEVFGLTNTKNVLIDLDSKDVVPFTAMNNYYGSRILSSNNNLNYMVAWKNDGGADLLRQDAPTQFTLLSSHTNGDFQHIDKLW